MAAKPTPRLLLKSLSDMRDAQSTGAFDLFPTDDVGTEI
jgi:hypothetical protein